MEDHQRSNKKRRLDRVTAACDTCKTRKVKCNGQKPCAYCISRHRSETCIYSAGRPPTTPRPSASHTPNASTPRPRREATPEEHITDDIAQNGDNPGDSTVVPLEARLLLDGRGKLIFIGDCAPFSFLQTVRHLITSQVDANGFPNDLVRAAMIELPHKELIPQSLPISQVDKLETVVKEYRRATCSFIDLFGEHDLPVDQWPLSIASSTRDLILAIGHQNLDATEGERLFDQALKRLMNKLCTDISLSTVQGFSLVAIYMLRASQQNGAYLYFSLAARMAYAIGLHRAEVNASSGPTVRAQRDRMWKSLRVCDMILSTILGRPPCTSDVDCTVKYSTTAISDNAKPDLLDASVQIFMIIERVVIEVYSRKRISLRIADFISQQLKGWATTWLRPLRDLITTPARSGSHSHNRTGACQIVCSYYYCIMLLTRPFLIYGLYDYLGAHLRQPSNSNDAHKRQQYSGAATDAAVAFVDCMYDAIDNGIMPIRMPLMTSWSLNTALVLAISMLDHGGERYITDCRGSIASLEYFGSVDPQAKQYSRILGAIVGTVERFTKDRDRNMSKKRREVSSQLFGMLDIGSPDDNSRTREREFTAADPANGNIPAPPSITQGQTVDTSDWTMYDGDFFAMPWLNDIDLGLREFLQPGDQSTDGNHIDVPLFAMSGATPTTNQLPS